VDWTGSGFQVIKHEIIPRYSSNKKIKEDWTIIVILRIKTESHRVTNTVYKRLRTQNANRCAILEVTVYCSQTCNSPMCNVKRPSHRTVNCIFGKKNW